jgi:hypothetical protein
MLPDPIPIGLEIYNRFYIWSWNEPGHSQTFWSAGINAPKSPPSHVLNYKVSKVITNLTPEDVQQFKNYGPVAHLISVQNLPTQMIG